MADVFPLLSLPAKQQLLVISREDLKTQEKSLELIALCSKQDDPIEANMPIPETTPPIKAILSSTEALAEFNHIFDKMTKEKYCNSSLKERMIKALELYDTVFDTQEQLADYLSYRAKEFSIHLLNVKDFEAQFTFFDIATTAIHQMQNKFSAKTLYHMSKTLHDEIITTNMLIHHLLEQMRGNDAPKLYWLLHRLNMQYDTENLKRKHAIYAFDESLNAPDQLPLLKNLTQQLLENLDTVNSNVIDMSSYDRYCFISCGFVPAFNSFQQVFDERVKDRVLAMNAYRTESRFLIEFCDTLFKIYESQICSSFPKKENALTNVPEKDNGKTFKGPTENAMQIC